MLRCDFCGRESERVSRVALDKNYDRITEKHRKMEACPELVEGPVRNVRKKRTRKEKENGIKRPEGLYSYGTQVS